MQRRSVDGFNKIHPRSVGKRNASRVCPVIELHRHPLLIHGQHRRLGFRVPRSTIIVNDASAFLDLVHRAAQFHIATMLERSSMVNGLLFFLLPPSCCRPFRDPLACRRCKQFCPRPSALKPAESSQCNSGSVFFFNSFHADMVAQGRAQQKCDSTLQLRCNQLHLAADSVCHHPAAMQTNMIHQGA